MFLKLLSKITGFFNRLEYTYKQYKQIPEFVYKPIDKLNINDIYKRIEKLWKVESERMGAIINLFNIKIENEMNALAKSTKDNVQELQRYRANIRSLIHLRESILWAKDFTKNQKMNQSNFINDLSNEL